MQKSCFEIADLVEQPRRSVFKTSGRIFSLGLLGGGTLCVFGWLGPDALAPFIPAQVREKVPLEVQAEVHIQMTRLNKGVHRTVVKLKTACRKKYKEAGGVRGILRQLCVNDDTSQTTPSGELAAVPAGDKRGKAELAGNRKSSVASSKKASRRKPRPVETDGLLDQPFEYLLKN